MPEPERDGLGGHLGAGPGGGANVVHKEVEVVLFWAAPRAREGTSPSSVPQFPRAKDTGPAGAWAWCGRAAVFRAAARLLSPEQRWMFLIRGVFPGGSA